MGSTGEWGCMREMSGVYVETEWKEIVDTVTRFRDGSKKAVTLPLYVGPRMQQ
jgi:hypothetical protein